jgi:PPOX class probable F420-dependent enzyme
VNHTPLTVNCNMARTPISAAVRARLKAARVARLATLDEEGNPHILPVCFVCVGPAFYTAVDSKPKRVPPQRLARLRHIRAMPQVALVIDEYQENWSRLWWILVRGKAKLLPPSARKERARVIRALKAKYRQYAAGMLAEDAPIISITPESIVCWGRI